MLRTLTEFNVPSSVTSIGVAAFQQCSNLASISLPATITKVEDYTFANCTSLADVYYGGSEAQWKAVSNSALGRAAIHYNHLMADVKTGDWFADPVAWALENGVTKGTGAATFSPGSICTRGMIVTFLYRAAAHHFLYLQIRSFPL